jgi:hypothetical protein
VAATVGCQGAKNRVFAYYNTPPSGNYLRRNPPQTPHTRALQHTAGTTPPSGTPCEFTGRVWEVAYCSGKPKWAQDTAKTEVSSRNGTWTQLGALPWGGGHLAGWCWCLVCGGWMGGWEGGSEYGKEKEMGSDFFFDLFFIVFLNSPHRETPKNVIKNNREKSVVAFWPIFLFVSGPNPRGAAKNKSTDPPVHLLNSRPTHPPSDFFFFTFFWGTFLGVSRQAEFKNTTKMCLQKVHAENFVQNNRPKFRCQFFLDFFLFYRVFGCFEAMGVQRHYKKTFYKKNRVEKFLQKFEKKSKTKTDFFRFFSHVFGRFSGRGVQKHDPKNIQKI